MGLLQDLMGKMLGGGGGTQNQLIEIALNLINNKETGGLAGLSRSFEEKGLGDAVSSWIGTGKNLPVSGDQVTSALGPEQIAAIARKLGLGQQDAANGLAGLLPGIIDQLTPRGQIPEDDILAQSLNILKSKMLK